HGPRGHDRGPGPGGRQDRGLVPGPGRRQGIPGRRALPQPVPGRGAGQLAVHRRDLPPLHQCEELRRDGGRSGVADRHL
ncbi:hypothetical protein GA029_27915, partial [Bacteroides thetaiotaomicron]